MGMLLKQTKLEAAEGNLSAHDTIKRVGVNSNRDLERVKSIVDSNHDYFSKNEDDIENAQDAVEMLGEPEDAWANLCPESELNRRECLNEKSKSKEKDNTESEVTHEVEISGSEDIVYHLRETQNTRKEMLPLLRSLNERQRQIFYAVHEWCIKKISGENVEPMHIFITGGAGTGKSHLIKTIHYEASRLFEKTLPSPNAISVILTAFTGTAAFNIGGNTIHHVFSLSKALPIPYQPLKEQSLCGIRTRLEYLQILVIDEVSMVYKRLLFYIHERLVQIKKCKKPFGGVSVIAVGDFYQLPPVKQRKDERLYKENGSYPIDYWLDFFKIVELDEIMRQREDKAFATVLNSLRIRTSEELISDDALSTLQECIREGPDDVLHVYSTNQEANEYNLKMLHRNCEQLVEVQADDYQKDKTTGKLTLRDKPLTSSRADGLSASLLLAVNARVMLTRNVSVEDGLVNGAMGYISNFVFKSKQPVNAVEVVEVIFDSANIGKIQGKMTPKGNVVPIKRVEEEINEKNVKSVVRHQFPLKLSWACTAHKVQGMTTKSVVVNLDRTFSPGQAYVAISRVTSKDGLFIETNDESVLQKKIYADLDVKLALKSMERYILDEDWICNVAKNGNYKTILLFNVQSLRGHFEEINCDNRLMKADFVCLTETWLKEEEDIQDIEISGFDFHHVVRNQCYDDSEDLMTRLRKAKGGGVGVYKKETKETILINALEYKNIEGITIEIHQEDIAIITLYRPSLLPVNNFLKTLLKVVDFYKRRYCNLIIIGDMNEDAKMQGPIRSFLETMGFMQIVHFYTTEGGTILDHVYVTDPLKTCVHKASFYFSYHEAIEIHVRTK
nr:ATP-dependent DNA helicase pif1-like [Crassostrea gigas]